ncbi:MAG: hypothetical protein OXI26_04390 [bacterium]|nr:hypothetical protein [bacterium]
MVASEGSDSTVVRYEPDDKCPPLLLLGVGVQGVMLILASIVLIVAVTARAGGQDDSYISWAVFAALIIAGVLTALQATRVPRFGAGHILLMGPTSSYIAVSALALDVGGQALLASLTVASALLCLMLSHWLPLLRRIITPVVSGTVLMLIAVSVLPLALDRVREVPDSVTRASGPIIALVTLVVGTALALRAPPSWKPWSPLVTLGAGCGVAALFGAYDVQRVIDAGWFGIPAGGAPRLDLTPGPEFWTLLPAFAVVSLVGTLRSVGSNVAVQQASRRQSKVTDYRLVQSSLTTNGLGILLSGIAGSPPTTPYTSRSLSLITFTSVAARRVGYVVGASLAVLALFPKFAAVLISIPSPVMAAYILTAIGMLFVTGISTLVKDGLDVQKTLVVAVAFGVGAGLEQGTVFADLFGGTWSHLLDNGVVMGAAAAILLTLLIEATSPTRQARLEVDLGFSSLPKLDSFLREIGNRIGWNDASTQRLRSAGEETLLSLVDPARAETHQGVPRFVIIARPSANLVELEFLAVFDETNLEDRLADLSEEAESIQGLEGGEISLRLLSHYASAVQHQQYHGLDVVTVQVRRSA